MIKQFGIIQVIARFLLDYISCMFFYFNKNDLFIKDAHFREINVKFFVKNNNLYIFQVEKNRFELTGLSYQSPFSYFFYK